MNHPLRFCWQAALKASDFSPCFQIDKYLHGSPSGDFHINLKTGEIVPVE
ncbi:hypothetical protein [Enterobacter sp.]|nr:hypothetical protein [Enterobacter sp.]